MTAGFFPRHPTLFRTLAFAVTVTTLHACTSWQRTSDQPMTVVAKAPETIRVNLRTGAQVTLHAPFLAADSLGGFRRLGDERTRVIVPVSDVQSIEVRRVSAGRTILLTAALGATVLLIAAAASADWGPTWTGGGGGGGDGGGESCPLVYAWNGSAWHLVSGTFGGSIARPLARSVLDNLDSVAPQDGTLRLEVTNELPETDYLDALQLLAVDHEPGLSVASDPTGRLHTIGTLAPPVSATDFRGASALDRVRNLDRWGWESSFTGRDTARAADLRDGLLLAFLRPSGAARAHLVLDATNTPWAVHLLNTFIAAHGAGTDAWYDSLNAQPALAMALGMRLGGEGFLAASVRTPSGWTATGSYWLVGPETFRRQVLDVDLSQVTGDTVFVRLESAPALWLVDRVAMDFTADRPMTVSGSSLLSARDKTGRDVAPLIASADGSDWVMQPGDSAQLTFRLPGQAAGTSRTLMLRSSGWYRVHVPSVGAPDVAMLEAVMHTPLGISRTTVARMNAALARLSPPPGGSPALH